MRKDRKKPGGVTGKGFQPGVSGNPKGRPRIMDARQITQEFGGECHLRNGKTRDQHMIEVLYRRGCQGDMQAAKLYLGYRFGNPAQSVDLNATMKIMQPEEHAESILAALSRLPAEADEHSDHGPN
jgi:hypothetical protein